MTITPPKSSNSSLEDLINACNAALGSTPGNIMVNPGGAKFNIDDPITLSDHVKLEFVWPFNTQEVFLENGSDCHMVEPTAGTVADVVIRNMRLNGNKANNTGAIDGIAWYLTAPTGGAWKSLTLDNVDVRDCDRRNIAYYSTGGGGATVLMDDIRSYGADEHNYWLNRAFDSHFSRMQGENMALLKGVASCHFDSIYISGGFDRGIDIDDLGAGSWGPFKNIFTNIRVDNVYPGADADDGFIVLRDTKWTEWDGVQITNPHVSTTDKERYGIRMLDASMDNHFNDVQFIRDPNYSTIYLKAAVKEDGTSGKNEYNHFQCNDLISPDADDAEIELRSGGLSTSHRITRSGGQKGRVRRL